MNRVLFASVIVGIAVLATGSIIQSAYAGVTEASITNWTVTLTNANSGNSIMWTQAGTGLPDCSGGTTFCDIDLTPGQLRKCINSGDSINFNLFSTSTPPPPVLCKGPWSVSISGDFTCPVSTCLARLGFF